MRQAQLNSRGQCCGRKPITYKRKNERFCDRCCRTYGLDHDRQTGNWAWKDTGNGEFIPTYPKQEYAQIRPVFEVARDAH